MVAMAPSAAAVVRATKALRVFGIIRSTRHASRRGAVGASGASNRNDTIFRCGHWIVALRNFNPDYDGFGSKPALRGISSASPLYLNEPTSIAGTFAAAQCQNRL